MREDSGAMYAIRIYRSDELYMKEFMIQIGMQTA